MVIVAWILYFIGTIITDENRIKPSTVAEPIEGQEWNIDEQDVYKPTTLDRLNSIRYDRVAILFVICYIPVFIIGGKCFAGGLIVDLIVTDKWGHENVILGKCLDLPIDMISSVSTNLFGISVATNSGIIKLPIILNKNKVYHEILKLLGERKNI